VELRLVRARRLLRHSGQSILQIALACGFASASHFSKAYRARFGHTPRDERSARAVDWQAQHAVRDADRAADRAADLDRASPAGESNPETP
jgi:AraC-like DNA-binding protein